MKLGRPPGPGKSKLDKFKLEIETLLSNGSTQKFIANRYGVTESTMCNWIRKQSISVCFTDNRYRIVVLTYIF